MGKSERGEGIAIPSRPPHSKARSAEPSTDSAAGFLHSTPKEGTTNVRSIQRLRSLPHFGE
jgi:hypothetical protein